MLNNTQQKIERDKRMDLRRIVSSAEDKKLDQNESFWHCPCNDIENHHRHFHSHWIQSNLSEVEEKIKVMISIIEEEEDGDSFAKRADMYYKRRPQLLKTLHDLNKSYRCLAEKYDQISRSHSSKLPTSSSKSLASHVACINPSCIANYHGQVTRDHFDTDISNYVMQQLLSTDHSKENLAETSQTVFERQLMEKGYSINASDHDDDRLKLACLITREHKSIMWSIKEVSELIEDHMRQQNELVKRNEEKRMKIKELSSQMKELMSENEALKKSTNDLKAIPIPKLVNKDANKPKGTIFQLAKLTGCTR